MRRRELQMAQIFAEWSFERKGAKGSERDL